MWSLPFFVFLFESPRPSFQLLVLDLMRQSHISYRNPSPKHSRTQLRLAYSLLLKRTNKNIRLWKILCKVMKYIFLKALKFVRQRYCFSFKFEGFSISMLHKFQKESWHDSKRNHSISLQNRTTSLNCLPEKQVVLKAFSSKVKVFYVLFLSQICQILSATQPLRKYT